MKVFFLVFFVSFLLSLFLPDRTEKQWRWKLVIIFIPLCLFGALRIDFGNDYTIYENYFYEFHSGVNFSFDESSHAEIGYQLLCFLMPSYRSILVLNSILLCLSLALFCYQNVPRKLIWLVVLLIFLNGQKDIYGNLVGLRNGFSVIVFLLGTVLIQKRKLLLFLIFAIISASFHTSAILFLPVAYLVGQNIRFSYTEVIVWAMGILFLLVTSLSGILDLITPFITRYMDRYETYIENFVEHRGLLMTFSSLMIFIFYSLLLMENRECFSEEQNSLCRLGLLYIASNLMGSLSMRAGYFYIVLFIGAVSLLFSKRGKHDAIGYVFVSLVVLTSAYSLYLWMMASHVHNNPLYTVYHSLIGSW